VTTRPFAVVTGASRGIGLELAKVAAQNGFDLLIVSNSESIFSAAAELREIGVAVEPLLADLSMYEGVEDVWRSIEKLERPVDVAMLNAGVALGGAFATDTALEDELRLIALNVVAPVHLAKRLLPRMTERGTGRILITSSTVAAMPSPFQAIYGASRAFVQSFAHAIRNELRDTGITVTLMQPGPTETQIFHRAGMDDTKIGTQKKDDPTKVARQAFDALMAGDDHVIPGHPKNALQIFGAKFVPSRAAANVVRQWTKPRSR
jgi:short-subunit dehydrogenase